MTPTLDEQIEQLRTIQDDLCTDDPDIGAWDYDTVSAAVSTLQRHVAFEAALRYAISVLENEYRADPTLQNLARSMREALPENNDEKPK